MAEEEIRVRLTANSRELNEALDMAGLSLRQFNKYMDQNLLGLTKGNKAVNKLEHQFGDLGRTVSRATIQSRRFKFEWLGIMFAGMALSRVFGRITREQMQLFGVTDMLSSMWTVVMLPIMETIVPVLMEMLNFFMNLPESVKRFIGSFVIVMTVLGGFLMVIGQISLGLASLTIIIGSMTLSGGTLAVIIGAIVGKITLAVAQFSKFKKEGMSTMDALINAVLGFGIDIVGGFKNAFSFLKAIMTGDFKTAFGIIYEVVGNFLSWIKTKFVDVIEGVWNVIKLLLPDWMTEAIEKGWNAMTDFMKEASQIRSITDALKFVWNQIKKLLPDWMVDYAEDFGNSLLDMVHAIKNWGEIGRYIAKKMIEGITKSITKKGGKGLLDRIFSVGPIMGLPFYQAGGLVTQTGPAFLHRGERVIPKGRRSSGEITFAPNVYINATINSEMDLRILADRLNKYWSRDIERMVIK